MNKPYTISGVNAAILIYEMEFRDYALSNNIKNPHTWKEYDFEETRIPFKLKEGGVTLVKGVKPIPNGISQPPPEEYHFYDSMKELYIATHIYNEVGWDEFVLYRDNYMKEESAKESVADWVPCKSEAEAQCRMDCEACGTGGCCGW